MDPQLNYTAALLPQTSEDERPAVRIGDVLVFVYVDQDGTLRVTVDTEEQEGPIDVQVNVNSGTVWTGTVDAA